MDDYSSIAVYYDLEHENFRDDIDFYLRAIDQGPVLEIGAGTGRVMLPLAQAGFDVWGVDRSPAMLQRARNRLIKYSTAHFHLGDVRSLSLDVRFAVILLSLNMLWHVADADDQLEALRVLSRHLQPGGRIIIDTSNPLTLADRKNLGIMRQRFVRYVDARTVIGQSAAWDDEAEQLLSLVLLYDDSARDGVIRRTTAQLQLRYVYRRELELLLQLAGLQVEAVYGSYDLDPYHEESPNLLVIAESQTAD